MIDKSSVLQCFWREIIDEPARVQHGEWAWKKYVSSATLDFHDRSVIIISSLSSACSRASSIAQLSRIEAAVESLKFSLVLLFFFSLFLQTWKFFKFFLPFSPPERPDTTTSLEKKIENKRKGKVSSSILVSAVSSCDSISALFFSKGQHLFCNRPNSLPRQKHQLKFSRAMLTQFHA